MSELSECPICKARKAVIREWVSAGGTGFVVQCSPFFGGCGALTTLHATTKGATRAWNVDRDVDFNPDRKPPSAD
jgi:hypothetical protein